MSPGQMEEYVAKLTYQQRKKMPASEFAIPSQKSKKNPAGKGAYPIEDKAHARNALSRVSRFGTPAEKAAVKSKVAAKYPGIGKKGKRG